jgi:uncharacterized protein (DUF4415 family)
VTEQLVVDSEVQQNHFDESFASQDTPELDQKVNSNDRIEVLVTSNIFTTDSDPKHRADPNLIYVLRIGDQLVQEWRATDLGWQSEIQDDYLQRRKKQKYVKQRSITLPFESRYLAQSISIEIRNDRLMTIVYEGSCQYDQVLSVPQYL